jgi:site-specific recombinase XerD
MENPMSLEPITPEKAVEMYLTDRQSEVADSTICSHRSRLKPFLRWCNKEDIDNLNELTGRRLQEYRLWRREDGDINVVTEKTQMDTLRVFIRWLGTIDAVSPDLHTKVLSPDLSSGDNVRSVMLDPEEAEKLLEHLSKFRYASRPHVVIGLMWHSMMRIGAIHAADTTDYDPEDQVIKLVHRPETGTPIKNGEDGERHVALSDTVCDILDGWITHQRPEVTDEHGREPLITTAEGRAHTTTIRGDCYRSTRPCFYTGECPHDRSIDECDAAEYGSASQCPSSVSPHALRRGGITHHLDSGVPKDVVTERADVSAEVIDKHYDQRNKKEKMEGRREYLDNI